MTPNSFAARFRRVAPDLLAGAGIAALVAFVIRNFWQTGIASNADMLIGVYRTFELDQALRAGVLFPRIMPGLNFGYGGPLFHYYPPLTAYLSLAFHWLGFGWIESNKALFTAALLLGGLGTYGYARFLFGKRPPAFVAGGGYVISPYILLNVYERGALAESFALALIPYLLWAGHSYARQPRRSAWVAVAALTALLALAHNITALFALPFVALVLVPLAWHEGRLAQLSKVAVAVALGLGLSAFYWLPALVDRHAAQIEARMLGPGGRATDNLRQLGMLVQSRWHHDYWGPERFVLSRWQALVALLGILVVALRRGALRVLALTLLGSIALALLLQWEGLRFLWESAPLIGYIQYPWRLLGMTSLWIALLLGALHAAIPWPRGGAWPAAIALVALAYLPSAGSLTPANAPSWHPLESSAIGRLDVYERGRIWFALYSDYAPAAMTADPWDLARPRPADELPRASLAPPGPNVTVRFEAPDRLEIDTQSDQPFTLTLPRIYFPGWRATVDGRAANAHPEGRFALVSVPVPAGAHTVTATLGPTVAGLLGTILTALSLIAFIVALRHVRPRWMILAGLAALLLVVALGIAQYGLRDRAHRPDSLSITVGQEIRLQGYEVAARAVTAGETLPVRLYWLALASPQQDYKVFLHLIKPDDSGPVAQADNQPNLGYRPMTGWTPGELVVDEQWLTIPADLPPGRYRLVAGVYRPDTVENLIASGQAEILPGDRIVLADIEVRGKDGQP